MTLLIDLTPETEARLQANAAQAGKPVAEFLQLIIEQLPVPCPPPSSTSGTASNSGTPHNGLAALIQQWQTEAADMTPEQQAEEDKDWDEIMENLRTNRLSLPIPDVASHD